MRGNLILIMGIVFLFLISFVSADLESEVYSYYFFEDDVTDEIGNLDGVLVEDYSFTANGIIGDALTISGTSTLNAVTFDNWGDMQSGMGMSVWIYAEDFSQINYMLIYSVSGKYDDFTLRTDTSGDLILKYSDGANYEETIKSISVDTWYHVVINFPDNGYATVYVDGTLELTTTNVVDGIDWRTAGGLKGTNYLTGNYRLDELGVWGRVLTTDEISDLYNSGSGNQYPFSSCGGCVYCGTGDWIIQESCHITESTKIETGYGLYVASGYEVLVDIGVSIT